jgi:hypothetical protein
MADSDDDDDQGTAQILASMPKINDDLDDEDDGANQLNYEQSFDFS